MKKSKKFLSVLLAVCMVLAMSAPAFAVQESGEEFAYHISMTPAMLRSITPRSSFTENTFLPLINQSGTNGNACGEFTADASNVSFTITSAPGAATYNVQLYKGTIADGGTKVSTADRDFSIGNGASFGNLKSGATYYFKVSSKDAPKEGATATYTVTTF